MRKKLFIVDAMALAYRSFFAFGRPLSRSDGFPTSAIFGAAMFMNKLITEERPDFLAVVTDTPEPTFRHEKYEAYKATRDVMPDDLSKQLPEVFKLFSHYGCEVVKAPGFEADDVIGTMARKFAGKNLDVFIVSGDKDFLQLIDEHVFLYSPKKNEQAQIVDREGVRDRFQCTPEQVIDALALIGDKVDNVPGVPGIGEKGAAKLIGKFGSLEGIYENLEQITGKKQKEGLLEHREAAFLSRELVTIKTDVPIELQLESFSCNPDQASTNDDLLSFYKEMQFNQLATKVEASQGKRQGVGGKASPTRKPSTKKVRNYIKLEEAQALPGGFGDDGVVSISVDVRQKDLIDDPAEFVALYDGKTGLLLSLAHHKKAFQTLLSQSGATLVGHGLKGQFQLLWNARVEVDTATLPFIDTKICDYLLDPNSGKHDLDAVAPRHAGLVRQALDDDEILLDDEAQNQLVRDAEVVFEVYEVILPKVLDMGMEKVLREIDTPLIPVLARVEQAGVYVDADFLMSFSGELDERAKALEKEIHKVAGEEFNINSPKQLQRILFEKLAVHEELGVKRLKKTKSGFSTDESVLKRLSKHPVASLILDYRSVTKLKNTYMDSLPQHVHQKSGRLHTKLRQTVAATGRLSSDKPNLQNIPMRTELGRRIRKAFVTQSKEDVLISADYSQVELRLLAHLANAQELIEAFKQGLDIHRVTAAKIFGLKENEVDGVTRNRAKSINFGIIYGMGPQRLAQETGVSLGEAKEFIEKYFDAYPVIANYTKSLIRAARTKGYSETMTGRRRPIVGINESNRAVLARAENIAINAPIQGSAADLIKLAMINIDRRIQRDKLPLQMILQIHDELLFSCRKTFCAEGMSLIKDEMEHAFVTKVPLLVEVASGENWLEAH